MPLLAAAPAAAVAWPWAVPFGLMLAAIAVMPLLAPHAWERNATKGVVALLCGLPPAIWALAERPEALGHAAHEYAAFVALLGALYVLAGGIFVDCDFRATPRVNAAFLATGAVLANLVGTTGAAMLLIRPLLHTNAERQHKVHTLVFFIFVVCNVGGCLTPLADPPLFLGYLEGVPFAWTLRLLPWWAAMNAALIAVYLVVDARAVRRETREALRLDAEVHVPLRVRGGWNFLLLAGVLATVGLRVPSPFAEATILSLAFVSFVATPQSIHASNCFSWHPIVEVAVLYAGIFASMVPALEILRAAGPDLGVSSPRSFFWATGVLSGLLDNAPTYLTFLNVARGISMPREVAGVSHEVLAAISMGAVFMGATTYIGNGPNFMVKAIAEARGVAMPSFVGYLRWTALVLLPLLALLSWAAF